MVAVDVIKVLLLFNVIFQQMIDLFLAVHLRIRKNVGCFHSFLSEGKKKRRLKNRIDFLNEVRKFPSLPYTLKATKVEVTFITFVFFCTDSILLHS